MKNIGSEKIFSIYEQNTLLQDAVERNLITIGEAVNSILKINSEIQISNARKIVDARNSLLMDTMKLKMCKFGV